MNTNNHRGQCYRKTLQSDGGVHPPKGGNQKPYSLPVEIFYFSFFLLVPATTPTLSASTPTEAIKTPVFTSITARWTIIPPTAKQRLKRLI